MRTFTRFVLFGFVLLFAAVPSRAQVCGNGVREPGEECDDGNTRNGDGCSATCKFEQNQRINQLKMQMGPGATSGNCTANALGAAISGSAAQSQLQGSIDNSVGNGSLSFLMVMLGLTDLTGAGTQTFQVGIVDAAVAPPQPTGTYNGANDLDWWYIPTISELDASRLPLTTLPATTSASQLTVGPGSANIPLGFGTVSVSGLRMYGAVGAANTPTTAPGYFPPGHMASEHLDPTLTSFASLAPLANGEMCGNVSANSLAQIPLPTFFYGSNCNNFFAATPVPSTYLDLLVAGCKALGFITEVSPTQPDQVVTGSGPPYVLGLDSNHHVSSCVGAPLATCLAVDAYSAFYKFSADRVIERACPDAPVASNDGPVCPQGTVHLTANGQAGDYAWTGPGGFTSSLQNPAIANPAAGDYSVTVTFAGCTSPAATTTVVVNPDPAPSVTAPGTAAAGQPGLIASTPAHAGDSYAWSITNGTITAGQGTNQITFTAGPSGTTNVGVVETTTATGCSGSASANVSIVFGPPQNVVATWDGAGTVNVTWTATAGLVIGYEVTRRDSAGTTTVTVPTNSFADTAIALNHAYLYTVRASDNIGNFSAYSNGDLATTVTFTDDPATGGTTAVKAVHILELRTAVNAVRALTALGAASFTDPALDNTTPIRAIHISELRSALDSARANLGLAALVYTDPTLTIGTTMVKAAHVQELRDSFK